MKVCLAVLLGGSVALSVATLAWAQSPGVDVNAAGSLETTVSFADLDVNSPHGAEVLIRRLKAAAERVCGPAPSIRALGASQAFRTCMRSSMAEGVKRIPAPQVRIAYTSELRTLR